MNDKLSSHPLVSEPGPRSAAVRAAGTMVTLERDEPLYLRGEEARAFYLVLDGEVEATTNPGEAEVVVWVFGPGDWLGEHELLAAGDRRRRTGARARTQAVVFEVPAPAFEANLADRLRDGGAGIAPARLAALRGLVLDGPVQGCRLLEFAAGASVFSAGEPGDAAYFILQGEADAVHGEKVLGKMTVGHCFGELAVLDGVPRAATVTATSRLLVLRVDAPTFSRWVVEHPPLRALVAMQRQIYRGPGGATVTVVGDGTYGGRPCLTSVVRYDDGRQYSATKLIGTDSMIWTELSKPGETAAVVEYRRNGCERRLHLADDRRILKIEADGDLEGVASLCARLIAARPLKPALEARFQWTGTLDKPQTGELLCACVGLTVEDAKTLDPARIRAVTGAGLICGSCDRKIRALEPAMPPAAPASMPAPETPAAAGRERIPRMPYRAYVEKVLRKEMALPKAATIAARLQSERPALHELSNARMMASTMLMIARLAITAGLLAWSASRGWYLLAALLCCVQGVNYYGVSAIVHDAAHDAGFTRGWLNRFVGTLLSLPLLSRFTSFRRSHMLHHRNNQSFQDPKVKPPSQDGGSPRLASVGRFVWDRVFLRAPKIVQNVAVVAALLLFAAPIGMLRYEFSAFQPVRNRDDVIELAAIAALWVGFFAAFGWRIGLAVLVLPLFVGYALIALIFTTHASEYSINSEEHDPDEYELMIFNITNLTLGRPFDRLGFYFHRYHVEHHLFPTLPFYRLREASDFLRREYGQYVLPTRRLSFDYLKRGYLDNVRNLTAIDIAGKRYFVGSWFDRVSFGEAHAAGPGE